MNDGSGKSRYSINLNPAVSPAYYIVGKITSGPYASTIPVQWITTDPFGAYTVFNTNAAIDASGILDLPVPPDISQQPVGSTVMEGRKPSFSVTASSYSPMGYQWYYNTNTSLANAIGSSLSLTNVIAGDAGAYDVVITNLYGSTTSSIATLSVLPPPQLSAQSVNNGFQFSGVGVSGDIYWVQTASNLNIPMSWVTLATNVTGANGSVQFTETNTATQANRFYRLVFP